MQMFYKFIFCVLIYAIQLPSAFSTHVNSEKFLGKYVIPPITPESIDIDTSKAKEVNLTNFIFYGGKNEKTEIVNTGKSIEGYLDQRTTISRITGGPFSTNTYKFYKLRFYWANNGTKAVHTILNGNVIQLVVAYYFYNTEYGSFHEAIKHRDGLGEVNLPVRIVQRVRQNLLFISFSNILKKIKKPKSRAETDFGNTFIWYDIIAPSTKYFAYPGAYTDEETGQTYYCTTTIVYPQYSTLAITKRQFDKTFGLLENQKGKSLSNINEPRAMGKTPVIQSSGTIQILSPL